MSRAGADLLNVLGALGEEEDVAEANLPEGFVTIARPQKERKPPAAKPPPPPEPKDTLPPLIKVPQEIMRKSRFCSYIKRGLKCPEGSACDFAHAEEEQKRQKVAVQRYIAQERAKMGWVPQRREREERRPPPAEETSSSAAAATHASSSFDPKFKTSLCTHFTKGTCSRGDRCTFAHGKHEIRVGPGGSTKNIHKKMQHAEEGDGYYQEEGGENEEEEEQQEWEEEGERTVVGYFSDDYYQQQQQRGRSSQAARPKPPTERVPPQRTSHSGAASSSATATARASSGPTAMSAEQLGKLYDNVEVEDDDLPEAFLCPITQVRLREPVVASDGYTYERSSIEAWLSTRNSSPLTNLELPDKVLVPNLTLMAAMRVILGDDCFD